MRHIGILVLVAGSAAGYARSAAAQHGNSQPTLTLPWQANSGGPFAIGYDNGGWGGGFAQGLRVTVGIGRYAAIAARLIGVHGMGDNYRFDLGARLNVIGRTPLLYNLVRLYGGGGPQVFGRVTRCTSDTCPGAAAGAEGGSSVRVGGGGEFGVELFMTRRAALYFEVGGQGGAPYSGATVLGGVQLYPL